MKMLKMWRDVRNMRDVCAKCDKADSADADKIGGIGALDSKIFGKPESKAPESKAPSFSSVLDSARLFGFFALRFFVSRFFALLVPLAFMLALFALFFGAKLEARENPFEPVIQPQEDNFTSRNGKEYFKDLDFKLPSTARILKEITITYQNIDGSTETKTIPIDESIDWHYPLLLTQKSAIISEDVQYFTIKPFEFFTQGNKFYLYTSASIVRSFVLPAPYRIVIDLEKKVEHPSGAVQLGVKYFSKVSVGMHKDFYRFVITLDGQYRYDISKDGDYYIISVQ